MPDLITRLAPSPTGALHLGNARTFLVNWALALRKGWKVILRIEDLDGPRVKPEAIHETIATLRWLGLDWEGEALVQSHDLGPYRAAMHTLAAHRLVYPSALTRSQVEEAAAAAAASAPQDGTGEVAFPAALRPDIPPDGFAFSDEWVNWRLVVPDQNIDFTDEFAGRQSYTPSRSIGDFIVWTLRGNPAYQLAVVVDDARQGVTDIVRGDDLLDSTARQILLYHMLSLGPPPRYLHLPLVCGTDGKRLAKRHGDTKLSTYRTAGVGPERIIGLIARWCGLGDRPEPMSADDFAQRLDLNRMSRQRVTFTPEDDRWLRGS